MSNIKLPLQEKSKLNNLKENNSNQMVSSSLHPKIGSQAKIVLPITDIKRIASPIRDIILRASDDFAISIFDGGYSAMSFAGQNTRSLDLI